MIGRQQSPQQQKNHHQQQRSLPKRSAWRFSSWAESDSEDDDIIRPCAAATASEKPEAQVAMTEYARASTPNMMMMMDRTAHLRPSFCHRRSSADDADLEEMWECMLELQQKYHCYKSTRMEIAADREDAVEMMPTRACMDMLNDSIESLPEEGWKKLNKYLVPESADVCHKPQKWKFWKHT